MPREDAPDAKTQDAEHQDAGALDAAELLRLRQRVRAGDDAGALDIVRQRMANPETFFAAIGGVRRPFINMGRARVLMDFLLALPPEELRHAGLIGALMELAVQPDTAMSVPELLRRLRDQGSLAEVRFQPTDYVQKYARLGLDGMRVISACKYGDLAYGSRAEMWATARRAAERLSMPVAVADALFAVSRDKAAGRAAWDHDFALATALDHVTQDHLILQRHASRRDWTEERRQAALDISVDRDQADAAFRAVDGDDGLLLLTFHGGLLAPAREMYDLHCPPGLTLEGTKAKKAQTGAKTDQFGAGFAALKTLTAGGTILMAPDGGRGNSASPVEIAGVSLALPDGGPFLAHESGCRVAWYTAVRDGDRVVPLIVPGPRREEGERFKAYKQRFFDFYAAQVEALVTGDPKSLCLRPRWIDFIRYGRSDAQED